MEERQPIHGGQGCLGRAAHGSDTGGPPLTKVLAARRYLRHCYIVDVLQYSTMEH
jgi:hypothetical protein